MYSGHGRLCVCLSVPRSIPTLLHGPGCNMGHLTLAPLADKRVRGRFLVRDHSLTRVIPERFRDGLLAIKRYTHLRLLTYLFMNKHRHTAACAPSRPNISMLAMVIKYHFCTSLTFSEPINSFAARSKKLKYQP